MGCVRALALYSGGYKKGLRALASALIKALASARGSEKIRKKSEKKIKKIVPMPIYVFVDSEQKAKFKAKIKPCSHQLNCIKS